MGLLDRKVAVITGAARGQGRAHAIRFAEEGADIIAMDICRDVETVPYAGARPEDLRETVAAVEALDRRVIAAEVDVRDGKAVTRALDEGVSELGRLDIVVANGGISGFVAAEKVSEEDWDVMIATNLTGVWHICRAAMPHMIEAGRGGSLILTSSLAAHSGLANLSHYSAAKGGLVGLMKSLVVELGPHMIRVNTIHPGTVATPMALNQAVYDLFLPGNGLAGGAIVDQQQIEEAYQRMNALPIPWLEPVDIANAALFLASDMGRYVTGTELRVDAGAAVK